ncbi:acyl carrier protein [Streptomyces silvisoli]|uniref:Phosphopantetheine-binding protein n=1 Tax=Streptomyces silvisoli TaxID=3034235 RepID=A0ABT5ZWC3_9ACTN|nr:phosphopantetheine-binding protein [Streptomyces silvisoli]MDF3293946.1 phosphopantetheine-binding protein [Streptomyces silvisoli]
MKSVREVLSDIVDTDTLEDAGPDVRLRADLGLNSVETTDLQLELKKQFGLDIDLWDQEDYSLGELAERITAVGSHS